MNDFHIRNTVFTYLESFLNSFIRDLFLILVFEIVYLSYKYMGWLIMPRKKKFLIKITDAEEILTKYKIKIIQDYEGTLWKGAEIDNSSDLMMLALDPNYVVTAYYSTEMFKSIMKPGTLMVTVRKKIKLIHKEEDKEIHIGPSIYESILNSIKKLIKFKK